jgi:hypothetical protein
MSYPRKICVPHFQSIYHCISSYQQGSCVFSIFAWIHSLIVHRPTSLRITKLIIFMPKLVCFFSIHWKWLCLHKAHNFYSQMSSWAVILGLWITEFVFSTYGWIFHICQGSFWLSLKCKNLSAGKILPCHSILMFHRASDSTVSCVILHHYFTILTHMNEHQQCMHLMYDCHTYFTTLIKQTELVSRKQAYNMKQHYSKVTHKSLQQKEVYLPLVPYPN